MKYYFSFEPQFQRVPEVVNAANDSFFPSKMPPVCGLAIQRFPCQEFNESGVSKLNTVILMRNKAVYYMRG
ncbi:hypothetical protein HFN11_33260 [Rhizobium leguminosarum]|uniref:hypothetical protein n=1 Tax=Rhizobium leguminosarum TaxID=384 RepID=UPI001C97D578|nr:hypothetical protein [Rhizobium leguminosarum]MBY5325123.1 hypothetical protein [Rhizobium leguminosarum]